jgi:WD repeat-containing protein 26
MSGQLIAITESISPSVMIPEHRLAVLLNQVKNGWIDNCVYHNTYESPSLYVDHVCDPQDFPRYSWVDLRNHSDEVWYLTFSNDGKYLATASADKSVVVYDTTMWQVVHRFEQHEAGVTFCAWSPHDTKLVTCTQYPDCTARIFDIRVSTVHNMPYTN